MIDENAFGLWIGYFSVEEDEYGLEREAFVERFQRFGRIVRAHVEEQPLGEGLRALDLGHGVYLEIGEGDETAGPIGWLKALRERLSEDGFPSVGVLSHGSRWVAETEAEQAGSERVGGTPWSTLSHPSEPLRRAMYADAASRIDEDDGTGWGPGLYLDTEAVEALGKTPKNQPTVLSASGATYYRAGS